MLDVYEHQQYGRMIDSYELNEYLERLDKVLKDEEE